LLIRFEGKSICHPVTGINRIGLLAAGYLAVPPYFFLYKGLTSDGAYDAVAVLGTFLLYAALRLEESLRRSRDGRLWITLLGLAAGLGWWVDPLIVYFYLAVLIWFVVVRPSVFAHLSFYPLFAGAFFLGGFPWWHNNIRFSWHSLTAPELAVASMAGASACRGAAGDGFVFQWARAVSCG
jgi:hypothetical protein